MSGKRKSKELLFSVTKKDFDIHYFSGTGAGGQHRNKHQNCVRLKHRDSGAIATGQSSKDRIANTKEAFKTILEAAGFKMWYNQRVMEAIEGKTIAQKVEEAMAEENIQVETKESGKWTKK